MKDLSAQKLSHSAEYPIFFPCALMLALLTLASWPHLTGTAGLSWLPSFDHAQALASYGSILIVIVLGIRLFRLTSRLQELETARGVDNHAALHDALTGAANRRQFENRLSQLLEDGTPSHTLLMIDLDRFKPINDLYGHAAGDALLREITQGFKRLVRRDDLVARLGGDEFAILLPGISSNKAEKSALDVLSFVMKYRLTWESERLSVGASIGLVNINQPGLDAATLLAASDEALYAAKESGRGAIYAADLSAEPGQETTFRRINADISVAFRGKRSHEPEDGRKQEASARLMTNLVCDHSDDRRRVHGARRRHDVRHWVSMEPKTVGDALTPGILMRELIGDAIAKNDGGADFARWVMAMALSAASRLSPAEVGRIHFVLPVPARAFVIVPTLVDELLRSNALSRVPIRHITFILHGVETVYDSPVLKEVHQRLTASDFRLGFEIRADNLEVMAPLRHVPYAEVHLGRELMKKLRPGSSDNATLDALLAITKSAGASLVSSCVDTQEEAELLTSKGVRRFAGPVSGTPQPLHEVLSGLSSPSKAQAHALC
ncbi:bifunctional diguanylate cyclase/phosphodiesterase [Granulosicoccus sp. 3-233]|uniref:bifunctional diguanylate cyclase/phosphodiesterase n=1 Tax=Granulosicoccus sp. 3-233 TaxID=3417969 RepID=UPI003D333ECB